MLDIFLIMRINQLNYKIIVIYYKFNYSWYFIKQLYYSIVRKIITDWIILIFIKSIIFLIIFLYTDVHTYLKKEI